MDMTEKKESISVSLGSFKVQNHRSLLLSHYKDVSTCFKE